MRRWNREPTWSASCSLRRRRAISRWKPRARWASASGRAAKVALTVDADDGRCRDIVEALKPDMLQLHGKETPERVVALRGAFRAAGDEGAADRERGGSRARSIAIRKVADRLLFDARAPQDATRPGGLGKPFDWRLLEGVDPGVPFMLSGGLDAGNVAEALAHHRRAGGRCVVGRRARAGREGPRQDPRLHPRRPCAAETRARPRRSSA